uniref:Telomerase RNA component interacting RNase n=1 Tax=Amazona collaria TaxID=241587 RepID=A0A8B9G8Y2_9PSIT
PPPPAPTRRPPPPSSPAPPGGGPPASSLAASPPLCPMEAHGEDGEAPEAPSPPPGPGGGVNVFANDGSFLELFKRKMEAERERERLRAVGVGVPKRECGPRCYRQRLPVGRRRGGNKLALKTGVVAKKQRTDEEVLTSKGDAWAKYMAEVKKYKAHQCSDDDKTRPLVK